MFIVSKQPKHSNLLKEYLNAIKQTVKSYHSNDARNAFITSSVQSYYVKQRRKETQHKVTRNSSYQYSISKSDGSSKVQLKVCKEMYLAATGFSEDLVRKHANRNHTIAPSKTTRGTIGGRGGSRSPEDKQFLDEFFNKLEKAPSHYCRKTSNKIYLEPLIKKKNQLYKLYVKSSNDAGLPPYKKDTFYNYFKLTNYALIKPKKDMFDICLAYRCGNINLQQFEQHIALKEDALQEKENDKQTTPVTTLVVTEDTEALLVSPKNDSDAMYYRTKLNTHNLTYYNLKTKDVLNYLWTETSGGLTASIFTSIHLDYLNKAMLENPDIEEVIIWSNGCVYQNKNSTLGSALRAIAAKHKIQVTWKYL